MSRPEAPTGITTQAFSNSIRIQWRQSVSPDIKGYNIYNSQTSGGGISGYTRLNDELIQIVSTVQREVVGTTENVVESGSVRTTTTVETLESVSYFSYTHENLLEEKQQFYVMTAVNNNGEESLYSTEIYDIPLVVDTTPIDVNRRTKSEVILSYLDEIRRHDKSIDIKPGTITRDLHIDPHGSEFEIAYILIEFHQIASSFLTLRTYDDANNDRISDEVSSSEQKQQLRFALGYNDDGSEDYLVQQFIDYAFDKLAANSNTIRKGSTKSQGQITFYTTTPPTDDVVINSGEIISTLPGQNTPSVNFQTLETATFIAAEASTYYDQISQRYELTVAIEAIEEGATGDVAANTIVSTTVDEFSITNELSTFGGTDQESNADLADRALLAFRSLDVGTLNGYTRSVIEIHNVEDVEIIDAGHNLMHRDYDEIRRKHVFGKVDIYFQGQELEEFTENIGFLYKEVEAENMTILATETPTTNLTLQTINTSVTSTKPIFTLDKVKNVTQGIDYDIYGNVTIYIDGVIQTKGRFQDVEVNLNTGEIVFSTALTAGKAVTAKYDALVIGEELISSASGGETGSTLSNLGDDGIRQESYTIYKNGIALVETTEYSLNLLTGVISLVTPLSTGDSLTADYAYIWNVETVLASSIGGERALNLATFPVYPSVQFDSNGTDIEINRFNDINSLITTLLTDTIEVTYRYREADPIILDNQPVRSISTITGTQSGLLVEDTHYLFNQQDDIILNGNSVRAERNFLITYNLTDGLPSGTVNNNVETLVLSGTEEVDLEFKGVIEDSIIVQNTSRTTTYIKNVDYVITIVDPTEPVTISRVNGGSITSGQSILVDYNYGEILQVKYLVNNLVSKIQDNIDVQKHITADVLVKESPKTYVDITLSIVLKSTADASVTKDDVITAISDEINQKKMGEPVYKSDIIRAVDSVNGVDYVILPLTKMVKADNSIVVREQINTNQYTWVPLNGSTQTWITSIKFENENSTSDGSWIISTLNSGIVWTESTVLNTTTNETYTVISHTGNTITLSGTVPPLSTDILEVTYAVRSGVLNHSTTGNAYNVTQAYGIFENDEALTLVDTESEVDLATSQGFIASDGAILMTVRNISDPNGAVVTVTYFITGETGENNIIVSDIEHLEPGEINVLIA